MSVRYLNQILQCVEVFLELGSWLFFPDFPSLLHKNYYSCLKQSEGLFFANFQSYLMIFYFKTTIQGDIN